MLVFDTDNLTAKAGKVTLKFTNNVFVELPGAGERHAESSDRILATCCSPTSSGPPNAPRVSRIDAGKSFSISTTPSLAESSSAGTASRSRPPAMGSWSASTVLRAVRCAAAITEAVRPLDIELRSGVHTGEFDRHGNDLSGIAVHIGARIGALASPSEVLVSSTVEDLVIGSGLRFRDRGSHTLKGIPDPWHLFALHADLPDR
jgi:class 3 adenylate cyclase